MSYITFIIPTIGRNSLTRAIDSIKSQTVCDWNIIVVFDGCKNNLSDEYLNDEKIKIIEAKSQRSPGLTRNVAFNYVNTKWIGFLDDDDVLYDKYIEELQKEDHDEIGFVLFKMITSRLVPRKGINKIMINEAGISFAIKNEIIQKHNFRFEAKGSEDWKLLDTMEKSGIKYKISDYLAYEVCRNNRDKNDNT